MKRENLIKHRKFLFDKRILDLGGIKFDNFIIIMNSSDKMKWVQLTTEKLAEWRGIFSSTYLKWALTINGLCVAKEKYEKVENPNFGFEIKSYRLQDDEYKITPIVTWDAKMAATTHFETIPLVQTYGFVDLYNCLEEFIFDIYRIYWQYNPNNLIQDKEFKDLKDLKAKKDLGDNELRSWENKINNRINDWQRKKLYENLGKIFLSYCNEIGLKTPTSYEKTTIETWADCIKGISIIRNSIVHGSKVVSKELADFCKKPYALGFEFIENEELNISLKDLQALELFTNQLITGINSCFLEKYVKYKNK